MSKQDPGSHPPTRPSFLDNLFFNILQRLARDLEEGRIDRHNPTFHTPAAIAPPVACHTSPPWEVTIPANLKRIQHLLARDLTAEIVVQPKNVRTSPTYQKCPHTDIPLHPSHPKNPKQGTQSQYNKENPRSSPDRRLPLPHDRFQWSPVPLNHARRV